MNIHINDIRTITLDEMSHIRLMDRVDTKFTANVELLPLLLEKMQPLFRVQVIDNKRIANYSTQYFDTVDLSFFTMHQNGKLNRQKIRIRSYVDSKLSFLEVKNKNNKGRTSKKRVTIDTPFVNSISDITEQQFLEKNAIFETCELKPVLKNSFKRITFVNNKATERITIDLDLIFFNYVTKKKVAMNNLMILELKQDGQQRSDFREILNNMHIKPASFSKYCIGIYSTDENAKYNRFKEKYRAVEKQLNGAKNKEQRQLKDVF
ncbi:MAG: polyphosphate polymerase domain-containing protein [Prevotellaceae bacterium]|jgi:hypothetical protein|nr:polyphosphate polymerase domain-containing protein [Prevotellaceae bacterium]